MEPGSSLNRSAIQRGEETLGRCYNRELVMISWLKKMEKKKNEGRLNIKLELHSRSTVCVLQFNLLLLRSLYRDKTLCT